MTQTTTKDTSKSDDNYVTKWSHRSTIEEIVSPTAHYPVDGTDDARTKGQKYLNFLRNSTDGVEKFDPKIHRRKKH